MEQFEPGESEEIKSVIKKSQTVFSTTLTPKDVEGVGF